MPVHRTRVPERLLGAYHLPIRQIAGVHQPVVRADMLAIAGVGCVNPPLAQAIMIALTRKNVPAENV